MVDSTRMHVVLNGKLLEEVEYFRYLVSHVPVDGGIDIEVKCRMHEVEKVLG